jgi:hypothetical protein
LSGVFDLVGAGDMVLNGIPSPIYYFFTLMILYANAFGIDTGNPMLSIPADFLTGFFNLLLSWTPLGGDLLDGTMVFGLFIVLSLSVFLMRIR